MKVYLNEITGIADSIVTMYMSKRTWTREKEEYIRNLCDRVLDKHGRLNKLSNKNDLDEFNELFSKVLKWGKKHITMLRYIDFSFTVEGLHRAGQDDWDAHAWRFNNRIIRSSTRLADFNGTEKSSFYEGKVLHIDDLLDMLDIPQEIEKDGIKYVYSTNGYIREDLKDNKDVKRGLYTLDIPSNFIFKINLTELAHVIKERDKNGGANPEVKEVAETIKTLLYDEHKQFTEELFYEIKN